jgi:hypothetical protein
MIRRFHSSLYEEISNSNRKTFLSSFNLRDKKILFWLKKKKKKRSFCYFLFFIRLVFTLFDFERIKIKKKKNKKEEEKKYRKNISFQK